MTVSSTHPLVSIGLPVYNGAEYLKQSIDSVLSQSFEDFELILCDNASTDRTEEICRRYAAQDRRVKYHRNERNVGAASNYNLTLQLSHGRYFKWTAHDDLMLPTCLEKCVELLDGAPRDVAMAFTRRQFITHDGRPATLGAESYFHGLDDPRISYHDLSYRQLVGLHGGCFPMLVFGLARTETLRRTRGLGAFWAADLVVVGEVRLLGRLWEVPEPLFVQRLHAPTPLWLSRQTKRGESAWYGANAASKIHPEVRVVLEHMAGIRRLVSDPLERWGRYMDLRAYLRATASRLIKHQMRLQRSVRHQGIDAALAPTMPANRPRHGKAVLTAAVSDR